MILGKLIKNFKTSLTYSLYVLCMWLTGTTGSRITVILRAGTFWQAVASVLWIRTWHNTIWSKCTSTASWILRFIFKIGKMHDFSCICLKHRIELRLEKIYKQYITLNWPMHLFYSMNIQDSTQQFLPYWYKKEKKQVLAYLFIYVHACAYSVTLISKIYHLLQTFACKASIQKKINCASFTSNADDFMVSFKTR